MGELDYNSMFRDPMKEKKDSVKTFGDWNGMSDKN